MDVGLGSERMKELSKLAFKKGPVGVYNSSMSTMNRTIQKVSEFTIDR